MVRKSVSTIFGLCCAVMVLANSPTVKADGHESDEAATQLAETLPNSEMEKRFEVQMGFLRLIRDSAEGEDLSQLNNTDAKAALAARGVDLPEDAEVTIEVDSKLSEADLRMTTKGQTLLLRGKPDGTVYTVSEMSERGSYPPYYEQAIKECYFNSEIDWETVNGHCNGDRSYCHAYCVSGRYFGQQVVVECNYN